MPSAQITPCSVDLCVDESGGKWNGTAQCTVSISGLHLRSISVHLSPLYYTDFKTVGVISRKGPVCLVFFLFFFPCCDGVNLRAGVCSVVDVC